MKKFLLALSAILIFCFLIFQISQEKGTFSKDFNGINIALPAPQEGEENEKLRELYNDLRHKAAPGVSWKEIEKQNAQLVGEAKIMNNNIFSFANGNITGNWSERGAKNLAGSLRAVDYVQTNNTLYTISNGGSLWTSILGSGEWVLQNQLLQFEQRAIKAFTKAGGGERVLLASGTNVYYSDDNGQTLFPSSGITFPVAWGGNFIAGIYRTGDGTIFCLTRLWSSVPWAPRFRLYRSMDEGQSYSQIYQFDTGEEGKLSLCIPYNSNNIFISDVGSSPTSIKLFSINGTSVNLVNTYTYISTINHCVLKGTFLGGINNLYLMINNNVLLSSEDFGFTWTLKSSFTENAWGKLNVSMNDASKVSYGGVNAYRSINNGNSFIKVNDWSEYYGNVSGKLHADIMEIEYFKKSDNTEFAIINTHGGTYVSYDNLLSVSNLSLQGHLTGELYDVLTDTLNPNRIFAGSQDQGIQRTLTGLNAGAQNFVQITSGDYGQLSLTNNNNFLWPQYPGGTYFLFNSLGNPSPAYIGQWSTPGSQKPNYGWMLAATSTANPAANDIWIGGGNLTGNGGSYLIKASLPISPPYTVSATQFNYDFRAQSRTNTAGITAIEQSFLNPDKLFVATEDGSFFYSINSGLDWNKNPVFIGPYPWYLYGSCILASRINDNLIWYCGSGYSNPAVYKSTDGGVSFSPMSNGLPQTLVNEIVASPDERFIFAATEAGPYVYVANENLWYSLSNNTMPTQFFSGVEYIRSENIVRFATMGRGIWDFKITGTLPIVLTNWQARKNIDDVVCTWQTSQEINTSHFSVERSADAINFNSLGNVAASGNSSSLKNYSFTDRNPIKGMNYFRLKTIDIDNKISLSKTIAIKMDGTAKSLMVYPNPAKNILFVQTNFTRKEDVVVQIIDASGRVIMEQKKLIDGQTAFSFDIAMLTKAVYAVLLRGITINESQRFLKQ